MYCWQIIMTSDIYKNNLQYIQSSSRIYQIISSKHEAQYGSKITLHNIPCKHKKQPEFIHYRVHDEEVVERRNRFRSIISKEIYTLWIHFQARLRIEFMFL